MTISSRGARLYLGCRRLLWSIGLSSVLCSPLFSASRPLSSSESELAQKAGPVFKQFCVDCHNSKKAKGGINLEAMSASPDFAVQFKNWEKVLGMVEQKEMPPEEKKQPTEVERQKLLTTVKGSLDDYIREHSGDPGRVVLRRLTSGEYSYVIHDLTGLDLGLERLLLGDAVGGEGFANVGDVQFFQDSALERYLEAAKIVADHAVVGAGPLRFYQDAGKTGQELLAIQRIQKIYQEHGFRTASGEGGEAFGLDRYPKAFHAAWKFKHRDDLGLNTARLADLAHAEGLDAPFVEHIWKVLTNSELHFPANLIRKAWQDLPPSENGKENSDVVRRCEKLYALLNEWQLAFAENTGDAEVAVVLSETSFRPTATNFFRVRLAWPAGTTNAQFELAIRPLSGESAAPTVLWHDPVLRFRKAGVTGMGQRGMVVPLQKAVDPAGREALHFGASPAGSSSIGQNDFATSGQFSLPIGFSIPQGMGSAEFSVKLELRTAETEDAVVRAVLTHELNEGATAAARGSFSVLLANPQGSGIGALKSGVSEFARLLPQISHREAAPADRDPIPYPFDNNYNNPERNEYHYTIKYEREDRFLTEHMLEPSTRTELEEAWADLLTAFDYHESYLRFMARKFKEDITGRTIATIVPEELKAFPEQAQLLTRELQTGFKHAHEMLEAAESRHVADALRFAERAWRRPLASAEEDRLRAFYAARRKHGKAGHPEALRSLLARILISPAFLYKIEAPASPSERVPLSDNQIASRLSFFLWSSLPDAGLLNAARLGKLHDPAELAVQARRMLHDPKARRFAAEFFGQWLGFYRFDHFGGIDSTRFPEFTPKVRAALYDESISFFEHIVREDRPVEEMLFADYSFLNADLAKHYGLPISAPTNSLARIDGLGSMHHGGLLRLGTILAATSAPLRTSPVKRGDWLLRRVLGTPVPPPPGDAGSIPPDDVAPDKLTVRQRLEAHRKDAACVNCHARMDALGFALEHFDPVGRWREQYRDGQPIDAGGRLQNGVEISEFEGLAAYLKSQQPGIRRNLCAKLLGYALGRAEIISDRPLLDEMVSALSQNNRFSTLVERVVTSPQFRYMRGSAQSGPEEVSFIPKP